MSVCPRIFLRRWTNTGATNPTFRAAPRPCAGSRLNGLGCGRMAETTQVNVRVPVEAKELFTRLAFRLRQEPDFLRQLSDLVDGISPVDVAERLARLEARIDALEAKP